MCADRFSFTLTITAARSEFSMGDVYEASRSGIFISAVIHARASFKQRFNFYHRPCVPRNCVLRTIVQIITAANTLIEPWVHANSLRACYTWFPRSKRRLCTVFSNCLSYPTSSFNYEVKRKRGSKKFSLNHFFLQRKPRHKGVNSFGNCIYDRLHLRERSAR